MPLADPQLSPLQQILRLLPLLPPSTPYRLRTSVPPAAPLSVACPGEPAAYAVFIPTTRLAPRTAAAGRSLLSQPPLGSVLVLDSSNGLVLGELGGAHQDAVSALTFLGTSRALISAGDDGAVIRWDSPLLGSHGSERGEE